MCAHPAWISSLSGKSPWLLGDHLKGTTHQSVLDEHYRTASGSVCVFRSVEGEPSPLCFTINSSLLLRPSAHWAHSDLLVRSKRSCRKKGKIAGCSTHNHQPPARVIFSLSAPLYCSFAFQIFPGFCDSIADHSRRAPRSTTYPRKP